MDSTATDAKAREFLRGRFEACYPFHPATLSLFQRKWRAVPQFQQTGAPWRGRPRAGWVVPNPQCVAGCVAGAAHPVAGAVRVPALPGTKADMTIAPGQSALISFS